MDGQGNFRPPPLFFPGFPLVSPQSHQFTLSLTACAVLCIDPISSRGENCYNINPTQRIIKQRSWALNEGCYFEEYMFIIFLSHMIMAVLLLGRQEIDSNMGAGCMGKENIAPPLFSPVFPLVSPQSHLFPHTSYGLRRIFKKTLEVQGGGLVQHQPSAKDHQAEGLCPE